MKSCIYSLTKFLISIAVGLCIALIPQPTELLTSSALIFLGVFIAMILIMIFRLLPDAIAVLLGLTMCYCFKVADFGDLLRLCLDYCVDGRRTGGLCYRHCKQRLDKAGCVLHHEEIQAVIQQPDPGYYGDGGSTGSMYSQHAGKSGDFGAVYRADLS